MVLGLEKCFMLDRVNPFCWRLEVLRLLMLFVHRQIHNIIIMMNIIM